MRRMLIVFAATLLAGCMLAERPVWTGAPEGPVPGDLVRVETKDGKRYVFRVSELFPGGFYGRADNQRRYRVPYKALATLEVRDTELVWVEVPFHPLFRDLQINPMGR